MKDPELLDFTTLSTTELYSMLATADTDMDRAFINRLIDARTKPVEVAPMKLKRHKTPEDELGAGRRSLTVSKLEEHQAKIRAERAAAME